MSAIGVEAGCIAVTSIAYFYKRSILKEEL